MAKQEENRSSGSADRVSQMEAIMAEHETALLRYAARILHNASSAEDVVQNVFIKLFRQWEEGERPSDKLKGWLYRVTHNEAVDYIRRESRLRLLHERDAEENTRGNPDGRLQPVEGDDRLALVLRHLDKLKPREKQVVLLRLQEGLTYKEIAEIMGRTTGNVGNILHHAVKRISESLKKDGVLGETQCGKATRAARNSGFAATRTILPGEASETS